VNANVSKWWRNWKAEKVRLILEFEAGSIKQVVMVRGSQKIVRYFRAIMHKTL
jgi:hypothetical protein